MDIFTAENLFTLAMLILLQAVLGFDNLLYISIESKRVRPESQRMVRISGIGIAIVLRIVLLFVIMNAIELFQGELFKIELFNWVKGTFNGHAVIVLFGGGFIIWTAVKEIVHLLAVKDIGHEGEGSRNSVAKAVFWIVTVNAIFSFDSILSALAITQVFWIMATAIIISGLLMILLADQVTEFITRNRMYEVLGLFILFIVGILLLSEGGHLAHLTLFGFAVEPMAKSTFYFVIVVLVIVDIVQSQYQKRLFANGGGH